MVIDVSLVLSNSDKQVTALVPIEMEAFESGHGVYAISEKKDVDILVSHVGKKKIHLQANISLTLLIPCDRCLEPVEQKFEIQVLREIDVDKCETSEGDEVSYIQDSHIDVEELVQNEIFVNLPMKVLCSEDCKGICNRCGTNLNQMTCDCDTTELDPRMSKVLDIFNQFKEV